VAIFFSPSPQGEEDERIYEKNAEMEELDNVFQHVTQRNLQHKNHNLRIFNKNGALLPVTILFVVKQLKNLPLFK
jgi:hypothetical protein